MSKMKEINVVQLRLLAVFDTGQVVELKLRQEVEERIYEIMEMEEEIEVDDTNPIYCN